MMLTDFPTSELTYNLAMVAGQKINVNDCKNGYGQV